MRNAPGARLVIKAQRVVVAVWVRHPVGELLAVLLRKLGAFAVAEAALVILPPFAAPPLRFTAGGTLLGLHVVRVLGRPATMAAVRIAAADAIRSHLTPGLRFDNQQGKSQQPMPIRIFRNYFAEFLRCSLGLFPIFWLL